MNWKLLSYGIFILVIFSYTLVYMYISEIDLRSKILDKELEKARQQLLSTLNEKKQLETELKIQRNINNELNLSLIKKEEEISRLNQTIDKLELELKRALSNLNSSESRINELKEYVFNEINEYINKIEEKMRWMKENSVLPEELYHKSYWNVETRCNDENDNLNLACIPFIISEFKSTDYQYETEDKLNSVEEFAKYGGDCEDYVLFMKAFLNTVREKEYQLLGWEEGGGKFTVYEDSSGRWYYNNARKHKFGKLSDLYPIGICYLYSEEDYEGHCIIALSERRIEGIEHVSLLEGSETFEPQSGAYTGDIGEEYHLCREGDSQCGNNKGDIFLLLLDNDILYFDDGEWSGFYKLNESLYNLKEKIKEID